MREKEEEGFEEESLKERLFKALEKNIETPKGNLERYPSQEDPLYEEAKKVIIQNRRASASLLQRKLRIGYARAARLIDILEEKGLVGPGRGAKPREVYITNADGDYNEEIGSKEDNNDGWQSV